MTDLNGGHFRSMMKRLHRLGTVAAGVVVALVVGLAFSPAAEASVSANYWWGKSTWYSQSEVRKLQPAFRRLSDIAAGGGGATAASVCGAMGLMYVVPGLACGAVVGAGAWYISDQASRLDYAASTGMCARVDANKVGIVTVTPYRCNWR